MASGTVAGAAAMADEAPDAEGAAGPAGADDAAAALAPMLGFDASSHEAQDAAIAMTTSTTAQLHLPWFCIGHAYYTTT
jgi:hypothetical protein